VLCGREDTWKEIEPFFFKIDTWRDEWSLDLGRVPSEMIKGKKSSRNTAAPLNCECRGHEGLLDHFSQLGSNSTFVYTIAWLCN